MAAQNLVVLTRLDNGKKFQISTTKIVYFQAQSSNTLLEYIDQRGKKDQILVTQSVATVNGLTGGRTQAITMYPELIVRYINSDRIIYINSQTWGSRITYDISGNRGKYNQPPSFVDCTESGATINTAAGNTGIVYPVAGKAFWINGDLLDLVVKDVTYLNDFEALYDDRKTEFTKLHLSSATSYLSIGSGL